MSNVEHTLSLNNLKSYSSIKSQKYQLIAYYLLKPQDIEKYNSKFYGTAIFIGGFPTKEKATLKAKELYSENKDLSPLFRICKSGKWFLLTPDYNTDDLDFVDDDTQDNLTNDIKLHDEFEKQSRHLEKFKEIEHRKLEKQKLDEKLQNPNSLEFYTKLKYRQNILIDNIDNIKQNLHNTQEFYDSLTLQINTLEEQYPNFSTDYLSLIHNI